MERLRNRTKGCWVACLNSTRKFPGSWGEFVKYECNNAKQV